MALQIPKYTEPGSSSELSTYNLSEFPNSPKHPDDWELYICKKHKNPVSFECLVIWIQKFNTYIESEIPLQYK